MTKRRTFLPFSALRSMRQGPSARRVSHPRARFAFRMLKRVQVKGGRDSRLCVAPMYGRQLELFLAA